jgi:FixJ family two-component response regulator
MMRHATIFVIDDDDAVRDSLRMLLESEGFVVHAYASCAEFLGGRRPDGSSCLLLDVHLDGMSGLELIDRLEQDHIEIPTILMTGMPDAATRRAVDRIGAPLLVKPFRPGELLDCVESRLRKKERC